MVLIVAGNENVVADDLAVSFENGREFPNASDSNFLENVDTFGVLFGPSHRTSLDWGGHYCGFEIRSNGGRTDTRADTSSLVNQPRGSQRHSQPPDSRSGEPSRDRTEDPLIKSQVLFQLS